ncbi:DUF1963 domain-containing protein [Actinomadura sp. DC4]|uniref:DUF1963 domain-containing protein n=1 Tax=Actinomadura sp. DC4 TaxID=3055069 RepID=UPI0025AF1D47|nr:DUF1963 domain-containing protein [Actinomadura sp. DC4]MDN3357247.1 DUF1963 domain-containing protein [Actinomadura sp. DC4]
MNEPTTFRAKALDRDIPSADVQRWLSFARPCVTLAPEGDGPAAGEAGGHPMLPAGAPDPAFAFAFSIDCAAVPPQATDIPLPEDGRLLFFADTFEPEFGSCGEVRYVPAGTPVEERELEDADPRSVLHLSLDLSLPEHGDVKVELANGEELKRVWQDAGGPIVIKEIPGEVEVKLGGYPEGWNYDPVEVAAQTAGDMGWILLAEWSADYLEDLDLGVVHWLIPREDLIARRFDRVQVSVDMVG